ncbi:hypothetical protein DFH29DRAFT_857566 [Suillus ampliporus]|nr:hypothetical protein DFH29DRAFT_857566 [Suillus ampliporus]
MMPQLAYILTYTLSVVLCIVVFVMLCWHLWGVSCGDYRRGIEDHEVYKRIAKDRGDNFVNFYDLGKSTNLRLFFNIGPNGCPSYTLVLPLRIMPYTDGPSWAAKFDLDDDLEYNDLKLGTDTIRPPILHISFFLTVTTVIRSLYNHS